MPHTTVPIETIRLSPRDKQKLIDYIEQTSRRVIENERRALRVNFQGRNVLVTITNSHGQKVAHSVLPRNLSRRGLAIVHGRFVYPQSRCQVTLPMQNNRWYAIEGVVRSCRHVKGIIHEIALVFDEPLNLNDFVKLTASEQDMHRSEMTRELAVGGEVDTATTGRALVIDAGPTDRKLYRLWLNKLSISTNEASGVAATLGQLSHCLSEFDLMLVSTELGQESGVDLIRQLRSLGYERPIIALSVNDAPAHRAAAIAAGASDFLAKPFTPDDLRQVVESLLSIDTGDLDPAEAVYSTLCDDPEMAPLIDEFVSALGPLTLQLRRANADNELDTLGQLCQNLKGAGAGYGFELLTDLARAAVEQIESARRDAEAIRRSVNELIHTLRRVRSDA